MKYNSIEFILPAISLSIILIFLLYLYFKKFFAYKRLYLRFKDVYDIDQEIRIQNKILTNLKAEFDSLDNIYNKKKSDLNKEYQEKMAIYEKLIHEISILEEDLEFTSYGLYKPHYEFDTSEKYIEQLNLIREKQKDLIKNKDAIVCHTEWTVKGSKREGHKMTNQYMKLMLRAFNNECDAAVLKVKWNNIQKMEERIEKAYEAINQLGATTNINITDNYLKSKIDELRLTHEYQEKLYQEKEEQRRIRDEMREEEKAQQELEKAQNDAEDEEKRYKKALDQAKKELEKAKAEDIEKLNNKITILQIQLEEANAKKERAISRAQMTKSGHIYVISNIGSFGENIYKIGMTRRLEPTDRVYELGDASVPFNFDIHAMIFSENAPELERKIQKEFDELRLNLVNSRREFFNVNLDEIKNAVLKHHGDIEFTKLAEAKEFRESQAIRNEKENTKTLDKKIEEKFPASL
jgi:hypothetical protein